MSVEAPFALGYMELLDPAELESIEGYYDEVFQTWVGPVRAAGNTVSTVPTYISPTLTKADSGRDD